MFMSTSDQKAEYDIELLPCVLSTQARPQHSYPAPSATAHRNRPSASLNHTYNFHFFYLLLCVCGSSINSWVKSISTELTASRRARAGAEDRCARASVSCEILRMFQLTVFRLYLMHFCFLLWTFTLSLSGVQEWSRRSIKHRPAPISSSSPPFTLQACVACLYPLTISLSEMLRVAHLFSLARCLLVFTIMQKHIFSLTVTG